MLIYISLFHSLFERYFINRIRRGKFKNENNGYWGLRGSWYAWKLFASLNNQVELVIIEYKIDRGKRLVQSISHDVFFQHSDVDDDVKIKHSSTHKIPFLFPFVCILYYDSITTYLAFDNH